MVVPWDDDVSVNLFSMIFKRPHPSRANQPARHLFVGNCGSKLGFSEADIKDIFAPFSRRGALQVHSPLEPSSHSYVSFSTAEEAAAAVLALSGKPCGAAQGRVLMLKYAEVEEPKQVGQKASSSQRWWTAGTAA